MSKNRNAPPAVQSEFIVGSERPQHVNQADYVKKNARESSATNEDAYDPDRYRSVHQIEYMRRSTVVDNDGFALMEKPEGDEEEKAMAELDY